MATVETNHLDVYVTQIYDSAKNIIQEFVEDGVNGFENIAPNVWWNFLSSIVSMAFRIPGISKNEKKMERVVYLVAERIIYHHVPEDVKSEVLKYFKIAAPPIIDVLIQIGRAHV